jgi:ribonucleotide monophosphatase NagD (HAD superfamily)
VAPLTADEVKEDFAELEEAVGAVDAVVVGDLGERFDYAVLNDAFRRLMDGAELVALQKNRFWRTPTGCRWTSVRSWRRWSTRHVRARRAVMVGDDVESDVGGAQAAGLGGILVRTGKYRADAVAASGITPTATVDSIADVPKLLSAR